MGSNDDVYFAGVEGGATHSTCVVMDAKGNVLTTITGDNTNHWVIGMEKCQERLADLINQAKIKCNIPLDCKLKGVGLSLSGCEDDETNRLLEEGLRERYPNITDHYVVASDTMGALYTAERDGGAIIINGTGCNAVIKNPNGEQFQCGGWGHLLSDEGGAFGIAHRAVKICFDHMDRLEISPHPIANVWTAIQNHFKIESQSDLLAHFYSKFSKQFVASLCKSLAVLARNGDALAQKLFTDAGVYIAKAVMALHHNAASELLERNGGLHVVCVGSVWLSWDLLKDGCVGALRAENSVKELSFLKLTKNGAVGSVYMAADSLEYPFPRNYSDNISVVYHYEAAHNGEC